MKFYEGDAGSIIPEEWNTQVKIGSSGMVHGSSMRDRDRVPFERIAYGDSLDKVKRCLECPLPKCKGSSKCWYLKGKPEPPKLGCPSNEERAKRVKEHPEKVKPPKPPKEKKPKEPKPPYGYDRELLLKGMVHAYTEKELAKALDISLYMARKWLAWMALEGSKK